MCFSADADFVSGAVIGVVGLATLTKVEKPREIPLAVLPLAFALHQVIEGFVWQNLDQGNARVGGVAVYLYVSFAWVVLPVLAPLAIMLLEPPGRDRRRMAVFVGLGMLAGAYLASSVFAGDISAHAVHHTIQYGGAGRLANEATVVYIVATCGAPLLSSRASGPSSGSASRTRSRCSRSRSCRRRGSRRCGACGPRSSAC